MWVRILSFALASIVITGSAAADMRPVGWVEAVRTDTTSLIQLAKEAFLANELERALNLFAQAVRQAPRDADLRAWYADAARRTGAHALAEEQARVAISLDGCQGMAYEVLGELMNPRYAESHSGATSPQAYALYRQAVSCDGRLGSAWMSLWIEEQVRGNLAEERRALRGIAESGVLSRAWLTHGRWILTTLPPRAVAISGGDLDTYPPVVLQATEGLRADVVIVNRNLLELREIVMVLAKRHNLPVPSKLLEDGKVDSERLLAYWREKASSGQFGRPLVFLQSSGALPEGPGTPETIGPSWLIRPSSASSDFDADAVSLALERAAAYDWSGPRLSPSDRSPIRRQGIHPAVMVVYLVGIETVALGTIQPGREAWLRRLLVSTDIPAEEGERLIRLARGEEP